MFEETAVAPGDDIIREITFLDDSGDTTIKWDRTQDVKMRQAIQDLMAKGHVFFEVEYQNNGAVQTEHAVTNIDELKGRSVVVKDDTLRALYESKSLQVVTGFWSNMLNMTRRLKNSDEVLNVRTTPSSIIQPTKAEIDHIEATAGQSAPPPVTQRRVVATRPIVGG